MCVVAQLRVLLHTRRHSSLCCCCKLENTCTAPAVQLMQLLGVWVAAQAANGCCKLCHSALPLLMFDAFPIAAAAEQSSDLLSSCGVLLVVGTCSSCIVMCCTKRGELNNSVAALFLVLRLCWNAAKGLWGVLHLPQARFMWQPGQMYAGQISVPQSSGAVRCTTRVHGFACSAPTGHQLRCNRHAVCSSCTVHVESG